MARTLLLAVAVAVAVVVVGLVPGAAQAATVRYAAQGGVTSGSDCTDTPGNLPCSLGRAVSAAVTEPGDEVVVKTGEHDVTSATATAGERLNIHGEAGAPRPVIIDRDDGVALRIHASGSNSTLRFVEVRSEAPTSGSALDLSAIGITVEDVVLRATRSCVEGSHLTATFVDVSMFQAATAGSEACLNEQGAILRRVSVSSESPSPIARVRVPCNSIVEDSTITLVDGATGLEVGCGSVVRRVRIAGGDRGIESDLQLDVSDSIVTTSATGTAAIYHYFNTTGQDGLRLRNVTAIGSGPDAVGLHADYGPSGNPGGRIHARNVIARGDRADLLTRQNEGCSSTLCAAGTIDVAFSNFRTTAGDGTLVTGEGNQSGDPLFLGPDDFRVADGSPVIDAGTADLLGPLAFDGSERVQGAAVDIGAHERAPAPPAPLVAEQQPPADPPAPPPLVVDTIAPVLSNVSLARRTVRRGRALRLRLTSSEAAALRIRVIRRVHGRRRGGRCVPRLRTGRRCVRRRVLKTLVRPLTAGPNALRLRVGRLPVGALRLELVATDAGGNRSAVTRLGFRVRR